MTNALQNAMVLIDENPAGCARDLNLQKGSIFTAY